MIKKKDHAFSILIRDAEKALVNGTLWELDVIAETYIKNRPESVNNTNNVLKRVANEYSISERELVKSKKRGTIQTARKMVFCLLHLKFNQSQLSIARFFSTHQTSVARAIQLYKDSIDMQSKNPPKDLIDFLAMFKKLESEL